jgi:phosphate transport system substrate-binding protein
MNRRIYGLTGAFATAVVALGGLFLTPQAAHAQELTGAGSTFINPIMTKWIAEYKTATGVSVNYQSIGSGGGITGLIARTVDFAGSDAPMNAGELASAGGAVVHLPVVIGTECVAYNIPGILGGVRLDGPVIADIYLGKITRWNDPRITKPNPGTKFPDAAIFVTHRTDGSGTTYIFTDYLSKVSPDWKDQVGTGKAVRWPAGNGGKGNEGVAGLLKTHPYSIGYIELAYAVQNVIPYALVKNAKGKYIYPTAEAGSVAANGVSIPADMRVSITNTSNPTGYPITGFSWLIVRKGAAKAPQLKKFLDWVVTSGQAFCGALDYAPIPKAIVAREQKMISSI